MNRLKYILFGLSSLCLTTACTDALEPIAGGETEQGEPVLFTTLVPDGGPSSRGDKEDWVSEMKKSYTPVNEAYTFDIEMWKEGADAYTGKSVYKPVVDEDDSYATDGTLKNVNDAPLYWQDNANKWGFKATAGTETLEALQNTQELWLAQDKLIGYSYLPIWDDEQNHETDNINAINYRTSKEWYADNKKAKDLSGVMADPTTDDYKKVPLYMQHQRSWITIILKAGEGVTREALAYATAASNIQTYIYSYKEGEEATPLQISAWANEEKVDYTSDKNGPAATEVSTTRYDAIVEPYNFMASKDTQEKIKIARITVSNQHFTFAAANDFNYATYSAAGATEEDKKKMDMYNLGPGKHLTITATLTRDSRMIMITAWIEDWTETVTQTICDDYGQNGDPVLINNRHDLIEFLTNEEKNMPGSVGMIVPNTLPLDSADYIWDGSEYKLKATLNLASSQLISSKQLVKNIERTGSIINGEIMMVDAFNASSALAIENHGTIERVRVKTTNELSPARASVGGLVNVNYGTINQCSSSLTVQGITTGYIGGIAGSNLYPIDSDILPAINGCTVSARVDGTESVTGGGGIVGLAEGHVSNNTYEYGMTILQNPAKFQNIIAAIGSNPKGLPTHSNNAWPTTEKYRVGTTDIINSNNGERFDAVIDNINELKEILKSSYNQDGQCYRIANSFTVDKENWIWGEDVLDNTYFSSDASGTYANGTIKFKLDGNDKTITLSGNTYSTMLFGNIIGEVYDLNLYLERPLVADRIFKKHDDDSETQDDSNTDAIAALAYDVTVSGSSMGVIRNIQLKGADDAYIQASTPGGITVWASHGGSIENCASNVPVKMHLTSGAGIDARHYAGGIVACVHKATITRCKYYAISGIGWDETADNDKAKQRNCRYGGIVGGTSELANVHEDPNLVLTDSYSWWTLPEFDEEVTVYPVMGSIIGSTVYHDASDATKLFNAMAEGNAGNWWTGETGAGLTKTPEVNEEDAIGKRNSVVPTIPKEWEKRSANNGAH